MNEPDDGIDEARAATITKNIDLAFRSIAEMLDDPSKIEQVPDGATLFVAPEDNPALERNQTQRALEMAAAGQTSYLWRLGRPPGERSAWHVRTLTPRWPTDGIDPVAVYDHATDLLVVDFFNNRRHGDTKIGTPDLGILVVDSATNEVIANALPEFLDRLVRRDPTMIDVLLRPETELRGVTRQEIVRLRARLRGEAGLAVAAAPATFAAISERLEKLSA